MVIFRVNFGVRVDLIMFLQAKALELAKLLGIQNFYTSNGCHGNFRKRHDILFKTIRGEAGAVDLNVVRRWIEEELNPVLNEFDPEDVYNADETGSYYTMMPDRTLAFKGQLFEGREQSHLL